MGHRRALRKATDVIVWLVEGQTQDMGRPGNANLFLNLGKRPQDVLSPLSPTFSAELLLGCVDQWTNTSSLLQRSPEIYSLENTCAVHQVGLTVDHLGGPRSSKDNPNFGDHRITDLDLQNQVEHQRVFN